MVKLPVENVEYHLQDIREWVYRYHVEHSTRLMHPIRLLDLEAVADTVANHIYTHHSTSTAQTKDILRQTAMNRIRQVFKMEFKLCCDVCRTGHYQDEISAPER